MLVLSRRLGEKVLIGGNICITVVDIDRGKIRLGIEAPKSISITRDELYRHQYGEEAFKKFMEGIQHKAEPTT